MNTVQALKETLSTLSAGEAESMQLEIYDTSGRKYLVQEMYLDEGVFCIDVELDPNAA